MLTRQLTHHLASQRGFARHLASRSAVGALDRHYVDGEWVLPLAPRPELIDVVNPATEECVAKLAIGTSADVDRAVAAARAAFETYSETPKEERLAQLERLAVVYEARAPEMAQAISTEMGAPISMATKQQAAAGLGHLKTTIQVLREFQFGEVPLPGAKTHERLRHEAIGVCALITPWNWPLNQVALKVAPALAAGCTVVLKPSEIAPLSSHLFAEMVHEAGFPAGAFNLVSGDGATVGAALSAAGASHI